MAASEVGKLLTRRESYSHWVREHVRWSDTDLVGHANNLAFSAFAETGRCMFLKRFIAKDSAERAMLLPVQLVVNLLGEVFWADPVDVGTGVIEIGNSSCRFGQGLFSADRCFGTSESVFVLIDEASRRPRRIPDSMRDWLTSYSIR